jgi:site-specific recombinase XerC
MFRKRFKPKGWAVMNQAIQADPVHELPENPSALVAYYQNIYLKSLDGSENTKRAYAADLRSYEQFCHGCELLPYPAALYTLVNYLAHLATSNYKIATIRRHLSSILKKHYLQRLPSVAGDPVLCDVMAGITMDLGVEQRQAPAFTVEHLKSCVSKLELATTTGLRDRAILLMGFAGAFRRCELVALNLEHLKLQGEALVVSIEQSNGEVEEKALFYAKNPLFCPISAYREWVGQLRGRRKGPLFVSIQRGCTPGTGLPTKRRLSGNSINTLVGKHLGKKAPGKPYTVHSLRTSFVTAAKLAGQNNDQIRSQTHHKADSSISRCTRLSHLPAFNAASALGL